MENEVSAIERLPQGLGVGEFEGPDRGSGRERTRVVCIAANQASHVRFLIDESFNQPAADEAGGAGDGSFSRRAAPSVLEPRQPGAPLGFRFAP